MFCAENILLFYTSIRKTTKRKSLTTMNAICCCDDKTVPWGQGSCSVLPVSGQSVMLTLPSLFVLRFWVALLQTDDLLTSAAWHFWQRVPVSAPHTAAECFHFWYRLQPIVSKILFVALSTWFLCFPRVQHLLPSALHFTHTKNLQKCHIFQRSVNIHYIVSEPIWNVASIVSTQRFVLSSCWYYWLQEIQKVCVWSSVHKNNVYSKFHWNPSILEMIYEEKRTDVRNRFLILEFRSHRSKVTLWTLNI